MATKKTLDAVAPEGASVPVDIITASGTKAYLYGSHSDALEAQKSLGGEVELRNLWCVVVKVA